MGLDAEENRRSWDILLAVKLLLKISTLTTFPQKRDRQAVGRKTPCDLGQIYYFREKLLLVGRDGIAEITGLSVPILGLQSMTSYSDLVDKEIDRVPNLSRSAVSDHRHDNFWFRVIQPIMAEALVGGTLGHLWKAAKDGIRTEEFKPRRLHRMDGSKWFKANRLEQYLRPGELDSFLVYVSVDTDGLMTDHIDRLRHYVSDTILVPKATIMAMLSDALYDVNGRDGAGLLVRTKNGMEICVRIRDDGGWNLHVWRRVIVSD